MSCKFCNGNTGGNLAPDYYLEAYNHVNMIHFTRYCHQSFVWYEYNYLYFSATHQMYLWNKK